MDKKSVAGYTPPLEHGRTVLPVYDKPFSACQFPITSQSSKKSTLTEVEYRIVHRCDDGNAH